MFPASRMVAPNSPSAREKASREPATIPLSARGTVIAKKTLSGEAPRVAAICSNLGFTSEKDVRVARTSKGKDMTAIAMRTPFQLKTISIPRSYSHAPMGLRRPKIFNRIKPVDTGGMTRGRRTIVSTTLFSGHCLRAKSHAAITPNGRITSVLASPTAREKKVICQVSSEKITTGWDSWRLAKNQKTVFSKCFFPRRAQNVVHEVPSNIFFFRLSDNSNRINNFWCFVDRHFKHHLHFFGHRRIR